MTKSAWVCRQEYRGQNSKIAGDWDSFGLGGNFLPPHPLNLTNPGAEKDAPKTEPTRAAQPRSGKSIRGEMR